MAKKKSNICLSCGHDFNEEYYHINPPMTKDDKHDVKLTKKLLLFFGSTNSTGPNKYLVLANAL